ncbi:O-antigen ligase family protein [Streptomyces sp. NPDC059442]|uniref:O-antigen ligase family protein n=1 Tax=Streptomyces sp. NPDC059442 TaxID=3346830 RepID=UPI0036CD1A80
MTPTLLLFACTGLLVLGALTVLFVRAPATGVAILLGAGMWPAAHSTTVVHLGVSLTPQDLLVCCALVATAVRMLRRPPRPHLVLLLLGLILLSTAFSFVTGAALFGPQAAGNDLRVPFLYVFGLALYGISSGFDERLVRRLCAVWVAAACVEALRAAAWWARHGIGSAVGQVVIDGVPSESRALSAPEALVIAQAAVILLYTTRLGTRRHLLTAPLLLTVVLLQHRTVWLVTAVMLAVWLFTAAGSAAGTDPATGGPARAGRRGLRLWLAAAGLCAGLYAVATGLLGRYGTDLAVSASDSGTLSWRTAGWYELLGTLDGPGEWLAGRPFGSGFERLLDGALVGVSPHNYYLHLLLRIGVPGVLAFVALYATAVRSVLRRPGSASRPLVTLACGQLVFALTYQFFPEQGLVLGVLCALALRGGPGPARPVPPPAAAAPVPFPALSVPHS